MNIPSKLIPLGESNPSTEELRRHRNPKKQNKDLVIIIIITIVLSIVETERKE